MSELRRAPAVLHEVVDGRAVLVDTEGGELVTLNPVGTLVWETLETPMRLADLTRRLLPVFDDVDEQTLTADVDRFVKELSELGLLETVDAAAGGEPA